MPSQPAPKSSKSESPVQRLGENDAAVASGHPLQALANDSEQVRQLSALQASVNASPRAQGAMPLHTGSGPVQRQANDQAPLQMLNEGEFRADPEEFLKNNMLSLKMVESMAARHGSQPAAGVYNSFLENMGNFDRHWFKLHPDAGRSTETKPAYNLTPAIEKYFQAFPDNPVFANHAQALAAENFPAIEADESYISSAYVPYLSGAVGNDTDTFSEDMGNTEITRSRDADVDFNPDFVFTGAMNGCAYVTTSGADADSFRAWHFQSPSSNRPAASTFRQEMNPTDWFGYEEYDDGNHHGLFEVTNLMHRGADDQWKVISQQNEFSHMDMNAGRTKAVTSRALNLGGGDRVGITKKVYVGFLESQFQEIQRRFATMVPYHEHLTENTRQGLQVLRGNVTQLISEEMITLQGAADLPGLLAAGQTLRANRQQNGPNIAQGVQALATSLEEQLTAEESRFAIMQSEPKKTALRRVRVAVNSVGDEYANTNFITQLIAEATPQQADGGE